MSSLKSNASNLSKSWIASLFILLLAVATLSAGILSANEPNQEPITAEGTSATTLIQVSLVDFNKYADLQSVQSTLSRMEDNAKVVLTSEANDLITLQVKTSLSAQGLIEKLKTIYPEVYTIEERKLGPKDTEVVITPTKN